MRLVWQAGAWDWSGRAYVWRPGYYVAWRSHHGAWVLGHCSQRGGETVWIPVHWQ